MEVAGGQRGVAARGVVEAERQVAQAGAFLREGGRRSGEDVPGVEGEGFERLGVALQQGGEVGVLAGDDAGAVELRGHVFGLAEGQGDGDLVVGGVVVGARVAALEEGDERLDAFGEDGEVEGVEGVQVVVVVCGACAGEAEERGDVEVAEDRVEDFGGEGVQGHGEVLLLWVETRDGRICRRRGVAARRWKERCRGDAAWI